VASEAAIQHEANWAGSLVDVSELTKGSKRKGIGRLLGKLRSEVDNHASGDFLKWCEGVYSVSFGIRALRPDLFAYPGGVGIRLLPVMEWFSDSCAFNPVEKIFEGLLDEGIQTNAAQSFIQMMDHILVFSLLGLGSYREAVELDAKFRRRMQRGYEDDAQVKSVTEAPLLDSILEKFYPISAMKLLKT
jgi:hypothetical protein